MVLQSLTPAEALGRLGSSVEGLAPDEAARRAVEFGPNQIEQRRRTPLVVALLQQFANRFALILWAGAALCFLNSWRDPQGGMATLGVAIVVVIAVNGLFSFLQERRAERAVLALRDLLPPKARAMRGGAVEQLDARELVPGDVLLLEAGDRVPADCRVLQALGVRVNTSTLTGEAVAEPRDAGAAADDSALRSKNLLLAGTFVVAGRARALVYATGGRTEFGGIARLTQAEQPPLSPLQREIARLANLVAALAALLGLLFLAIGYALGLALSESLLFTVGIIVANVPEGLLPDVTLSLAMASQRMARRNALVRKLPAVETLGSATVICSDKTGTLTQNRMEVRALWTGGRVHESGFAGLRAAHPRLFQGAALCQDLIGDGGERRGDPMELALEALSGPMKGERLGELPFDSERRLLSTLYRIGGHGVLFTKGALEALLPLCVRADGVEGPLDEELRSRIGRDAGELADRGLRVLAFAFHEGDELVERDLTFAGLIALEDPPRPEVPAAIDKCHAAGIRVVMITGDHPRTALAVGRQIGIRGAALTGAQLRSMPQAELDEALAARELIIARADPADKLLVVRALQRRGEVVAVTGDGANDAPALHAADIGIAMGRGGTDVAREAADLVLLDDNFATIVAAVEEGRAVFANIRKFLTYVLTSNVPELVPYLAFVLLRAPLALTILQILAVDLGTDLLPALALGAEPPDPELMRRPPRGRGERLTDWRLLARAYLWLGPIEAAVAMGIFFWMLRLGGWTWGVQLAARNPLYLTATTACLTSIVILQVANALACRSEHRPGPFAGLSRNRMLLAAMACELALLALLVYTPLGHGLFGCAPLPLFAWLVPLPFAALLLLLEEGRKAIVRRR